ncbi:MAG: lipid-A-disaccharide synthase [Armatimonadota bacterium]|nr:lipid-A-disaccharide synthase [Armatimonadota bacterium]
MLVAGEVSGDVQGAALARALRAREPAVRLEGVGGHRMAAAGVRLVADSSAWGRIGWLEVARDLPAFARRLGDLTAWLRAAPPDVLVPIDFPGFNLALLARVRGLCPVVYYLPPMVAIRRGRRAARVARLGARLLAVFPFEAEAYRRAGADVAFIGHPAVDQLQDDEPAGAVRRRLGLPPGVPVLGLLPGSRQQELARLLRPMVEAAVRLRTGHPDLAVAVACAAPLFSGEIDAALRAAGLPAVVTDGAGDVFATSCLVLTASGTATVEAMLRGVPMVVAYRASWSTRWLAPLVWNVRWLAMPNILAGAEVVPELLQRAVTPQRLAAAAHTLLADTAARERMRRRLLDLASTLGPPGAVGRAADEVLAAARGTAR